MKNQKIRVPVYLCLGWTVYYVSGSAWHRVTRELHNCVCVFLTVRRCILFKNYFKIK